MAPWPALSLALLAALGQAKNRPGPKMNGLPARTFIMGGDEKAGAPGTKEVTLQKYAIDETSVTNAHFREFVKATKFKTEAESFGWSFVLNSSMSEKTAEENTQYVESAPQWVAVEGAWWRQPEGKDSSLKGRMDDYPAVHISWNDAKAYCEWAGKRLPTEAEWENAARGKKKTSLFPWGDGTNPMGPNGEWMMNIWQGAFPRENTKEDGYHGIAPVKAYPPNSYGMYGMVGNIWEWTSCFFPTQNQNEEQWTLKGGSMIESIDGSFNHKASVVTRMGNTADSGGYNTGFRCAHGTGGGGRKRPLNQELLQKIAEEGGVEKLQEYLAEQGQGAQVMTPAQLKEQQEKIKQMKAQMEAEHGGEL